MFRPAQSYQYHHRRSRALAIRSCTAPSAATNLAVGMLFGIFVGFVTRRLPSKALDRTVSDPLEMEEITGSR